MFSHLTYCICMLLLLGVHSHVWLSYKLLYMLRRCVKMVMEEYKWSCVLVHMPVDQIWKVDKAISKDHRWFSLQNHKHDCVFWDHSCSWCYNAKIKRSYMVCLAYPLFHKFIAKIVREKRNLEQPRCQDQPIANKNFADHRKKGKYSS